MCGTVLWEVGFRRDRRKGDGDRRAGDLDPRAGDLGKKRSQSSARDSSLFFEARISSLKQPKILTKTLTKSQCVLNVLNILTDGDRSRKERNIENG